MIKEDITPLMLLADVQTVKAFLISFYSLLTLSLRLMSTALSPSPSHQSNDESDPPF
jgi:hypothetical protein